MNTFQILIAKKIQIVRDRVLKIVIAMVFIIVFIFARKCYVNKILNNKITTCAQIYDITSQRSSSKIYFKYNFRGRINYDTRLAVAKYKENKEKYIDKYFILLLDSSDINYNQLLIEKEEVNKWGVTIEEWENCHGGE